VTMASEFIFYFLIYTCQNQRVFWCEWSRRRGVCKQISLNKMFFILTIVWQTFSIICANNIYLGYHQLLK
jgi:hypothetical protein